MALPLTIIFCGLLAFMVYYMTTTRLEQKRQNLTQFHALQAHYLAQGAVQQALLKFRVLPTEAYTATAIARGLCPFYLAEGGESIFTGDGISEEPLRTFLSDINSEKVPLSSFGDEAFRGWHLEIVRSRAITSFTQANEKVSVVTIEAVGLVPMWVKNHLTDQYDWSTFKDIVSKTVEVRRGS